MSRTGDLHAAASTTADLLTIHDHLLVFIGPSGSGKSSVVRELCRLGKLWVTPSWTTRPPRADEREGTPEHRFVDESEFEDLVRSGFFLEVVQLFGLPFRYGLPPVRQGPKGQVPAIMVRAQLMPLVDKHYPRRTVYQIEDSTDRVVERIMDRGIAPSEVRARLDDLESERALGRRLASRVFVNSSTLADLVGSVAAAVDIDFAREPASGA